MPTTTTQQQQQQQHRSSPLLPVSTSPSLTRFTQHLSFVAIKRRSFKHVRADSHSAAVRTLSGRFSSTSELLLPVESGASFDDNGDTLISGELGRTSVSINLIKCAVGAGSFSLPAAFLHSGFWAGIILCCFLGLLAATTVDMLAAVERRLSSVAGTRLRYPDLALLAFNDWRGRALRIACLVGVLSTSLGVCSVYVIFISSELTAVLAGSQYTTTPIDVAYMMSPFILGLALLRSFKYLVFTSILGDVAVLGGLVGTVFIGASVGIKASPFAPISGGNHSSSMNGTTASLEHLPAVNWATLPEAAGSIAFLFLIHVVILPMSQSMKGETAEEQRRGFRCVTGTSYFFITTLNAAFGAICVCLFGLETKGNVLTNIAESGVYPSLVLVIRILLCVDLLFTIPMVLAAGRGENFFFFVPDLHTVL